MWIACNYYVFLHFERLVCKHRSGIAPDPHQFACRENRSDDDVVSLCLHSILQHLEHRSTYARVLFVDFSCAFNTIVPAKLIYTLQEVDVTCASGSLTFSAIGNK